jgi:rsbT antagonist protein RsbS
VGVPVPILKQGDVLIASIQAALTDQDLVQLTDELSSRVGTARSRAVVIDLTVLDVLDSFATRTIRGIAHIAKLRGATTVVVGIQPDIAFAMIELGLTLDGVETALDLEEGLELVRQANVRRATGAAGPSGSGPPGSRSGGRRA